ncbi:RING finger and transmembrane domain-containing protein 2 [Heracleum sosnowskyi]|uniref:RING finger and transmembrane domain-containing protein 2 n=1 Tax=Heracleum sosnowskyi TaxID=360622 RepID=A0AAD8IM02_9APIA|nr:RING finger and transmembrane domain-containing protein 2 [Heracleum sosnowskyi]
MESSSSSSPSPPSSHSANTPTYANPNNVSTPPTQTTPRSSRRNRYSTLILSTFQFLQAPLSTILSHYSPVTPLNPIPNDDVSQVSIRIVPGQEPSQPDHELGLSHLPNSPEINSLHDHRNHNTITSSSGNGNGDSNFNSVPAVAADDDSRTPNQQRYDLQQAAKLIEQIIPFSLLLLLVFIRQHLQGFFVTIYITAFMFKSNDILKKQTALKGERKLAVLVGYFAVFMLHVIGIYWWYRNDDIFYSLIMIPPKAIPPFWHAIFTILVNDTMVRQAAMAFKLILLMYYRNGKGHNFRRQGQLLTLVEYTLLLYRALLPAPVWYRFFLNKDYGSLFSSLTTGLYLTFKLTTIVEKVRSFFSAFKALSRKEMHYGSYATLEQVNDAGNLCAICQEKMHIPVQLCCKHVFCEDCVSEWFERERTCPLCRALVRAADMWSYGDGSTSLFFQLY